MLRFLFRAVPVVLLLSSAGCRTTKSDADAVLPAFSLATPQPAHVFVEGRDKGMTPATITVRRDLGDQEVALRLRNPQGKLYDVRRYEIELVHSSNRGMLDYRATPNDTDNIKGINTEDLPRRNSGAYVVPYYNYPIRIEDREYNLTLIVID
jgi:hypothetical protein